MFIQVPVKRMYPDVQLPKYQTAQAAGCDLHAYLPEGELVLKPGQRALVPTGLKMAVPEGYELQIRPRSGEAFRRGLTVLNAPGTIDADYRGEIKVLLVNLGEEDIVIRHQDRIAQGVFCAVPQVRWLELGEGEELPDTSRGEGGFGHTGK